MSGKIVAEEDEIVNSTPDTVQTADETGWDIVRNAIRHPSQIHQIFPTQISIISSKSSEINPKTLRACGSYVKTKRSHTTTIVRNIALILSFCALISVLAGISITLYYRIIGDENIQDLQQPKDKQGAITCS